MRILIALLLAGGPSIEEDVRKLAADRSPDERCRALALAGRDPALLEPLLPLLGDPHPRVRRRAGDALSAARARELARTALKHPLAPVRQGACEVLAAVGTADDVVERLADRDSAVRGAAAEALGRLGDRSAVERLLAALRRESDWPLRAHGLDALARLDPEAAAPVLADAEDDRHFQARIVVAERRPSPRLVNDADWRVRDAAFDGCRAVRTRESIGWLVERLGKEKGRLRWDLVQALHDLTGKDLGLEPGPWKAWWDVQKEVFVPLPAGKPGSPPPSAAGTQVGFFSIPILTNRMVFLVDLSGSMREPAPSGGSKLDEAKGGLLETVKGLPPDARFGIAGLGCEADGSWPAREAKTWGRRLQLFPAVPAARADAFRFVSGLEARGWTNLWDGLEYAISAPDADTVFLYSDGGASKGEFVAAKEILEQLGRLNRFARVVVHTVEVPGARNPADNRRLLADLAARTGGTSKLAKP
jgi:HEAT repeat protein